MNHRLRWKKHYKVLRGKALRSLTALKPLLCSPLSLKAKFLLYETYIWPMMTYTSPAWAVIPKSSMHCLQVVQNRELRLIGRYHWYTWIDKMHSDLKIPKLKSFIKHLALKLYASSKTSRNRYIKKLGTDLSAVNRRVPRPFHTLS